VPIAPAAAASRLRREMFSSSMDQSLSTIAAFTPARHSRVSVESLVGPSTCACTHGTVCAIPSLSEYRARQPWNRSARC